MTLEPHTAVYSLGAVILAAGRSRRMGQPKLLLPWRGTTVLGHLLEQWRALGARQVVAVCAVDDRVLQAELDRLRFPLNSRIANPAPERGMFSSIQCAAQWQGWSGSLTHWALVLGDQPHLRADTLCRLCEFSAAQPGQPCQPVCNGHRRHPVLLPKQVLLALATSAAPDLRVFLNGFQVAGCEVNDPGLDLDIDRPEDYQKALVFDSVGRAI